MRLELVRRRLTCIRHFRQPGQRIRRSYIVARTCQPASGGIQSRLVRATAQFTKATFHGVAVLPQHSGLVPSSGFLPKHLGQLILCCLFPGLLRDCLPTDLSFRLGSLLTCPKLGVVHRPHLDLPEDHAQGVLQHPTLPIAPATGTTGAAVIKLYDEACGALRVGGLRELLLDGDVAGEAVDDHTHASLSRRAVRPVFLYALPSPHASAALQEQKCPAPKRRRHHEPLLRVSEGGHDRMKRSQPLGNPNHRGVARRLPTP